MKNPYQKNDGTPIRGKEHEFFSFAKSQRLKEINAITDKDEREKQLASFHAVEQKQKDEPLYISSK